MNIKSASADWVTQPSKESKLLQGLGGYPRGVARAPPRKLDPRIQPPLERQRSNRDSGATVEGISKGYPI